MELEDLDVEAEKLLAAAGYLWDSALFAFKRRRDPARQTTNEYLASKPVLISYEELYDHRLCGGSHHSKQEQATPNERIAALQWLREIIDSNWRV